MTRSVLGILGGSGVYDLPGLEQLREQRLSTPWGEPSDLLRFGRIGTTDVVFLSRHGPGHRIAPSGVNYRANIDALKRAGVTDLVSLTACGSYREELPPGSFVLVDDFIDRTFGRENSFFGNGCVAHIPFAHPIGPRLQERIALAAQAEDIMVHRGGICVCMEGPQFSTLAESNFYKAMGCDVVNMTSMPEAKLAREAEITYAVIAMVTDYDCWHPEHEKVDVAAVVRAMQANRSRAQRLIMRLAADFPEVHESCPAGSDRALDDAIVTAPEARDPDLLARLDAVAGRVLRPGSKDLS
ncbi:5'-methylthioadenosine phosphorylase [Steroidobacter denitrificans]|uniref:S-methyl-5'-thioadenosine phosphorylase n=1 Tax=Steroidobacter denitrificans TaxID=465721 RepID=A0A127FC25_STEDE|nr:S-methyl-5'-thioadenosine phosphorylase [Steroidobacter denitrificans]AMN47170.1 5'-methylthioadenosine phosphorylase [Steroidobacter denitrificans]